MIIFGTFLEKWAYANMASVWINDGPSAPTALDVANVADRGNGRKAVGMLMHPRKATRKGVLLGGPTCTLYKMFLDS